MGGEARVVLYARSEEVAIDAAERAFATIARLEDVASDWRPTSELAQLTSGDVRRPIPVSAELGDVLARALDVAARSDGAFDPTIGPLVLVWRAARRAGRLPDPADVERAKQSVGHRFVHLDARARTLVLDRSDVRLDLGGIAKGHACQRAIDALRAHGIESALVQMGGDLVCSAPPPGRAGWLVDLAPEASESKGERLVLAHAACSNSGDREQHVVIDGVTYSHVVDPRTGMGLTTRAHAIVVATDGAISDSMATALTVVGVEGAAALARRFPGCEAWLAELGSEVEPRDGASPGTSSLPLEPPGRRSVRTWQTPGWAAIARENRNSP